MRVYHLGFSGPFQLQPFCLFEVSPITRWFSALICVLATCQLCPNFFVMQPEVRPKTSWPCDWQLWWVLMSENETFVRFPGFARVSRSTTFSGCFFEKTSSVLLLCVTELVWCIWEKLSLCVSTLKVERLVTFAAFLAKKLPAALFIRHSFA